MRAKNNNSQSQTSQKTPLVKKSTNSFSSQSQPDILRKKGKLSQILIYFSIVIILSISGVFGYRLYQKRISSKLTSSEANGSPLHNWEKYVGEEYSEYKTLSVFCDHGGDRDFYLLYKGKVYFEEAIESYHLDVLKKEDWRQIMASSDSNDFEIFHIKSAPYEQVFFVTSCQEEACDARGYKVFHYKWIQPYYEENPPVEIYNSDKNSSYPVPRIDQVSRDEAYLSLLLYQCWACGGHDPKTVLINLETRETKELGFVKDFYWQENGNYSFKKLVYQKCDYSEDEECNPVIGGLKSIATETEYGQFDSLQYQDRVILEKTEIAR